MALAKRPHVVVATPGRLVDHLENTKASPQGELFFFFFLFSGCREGAGGRGGAIPM